MAINIGENTDGDVTYQNPPVNRVMFPNITYEAKPEEIQAAVNVWLNNHPEATTTVQDGSILPVKLDSSNSATGGYILSYNATAGKFEWYDINSDITDLRQGLNVVPSNKVSVHLDAVRKHDGVLLKPTISNAIDKFVALTLQYDCYFYRNGNARPNTYCVATELYVPHKYWKRIRCGSISVRKRDNTELINLETPNATINRSGVLLNNGGTLFINMGFNASDFDETNKYTSQRSFIELYTDENKTTVERVIYADQINFEYISTDPFTMNIERTYIKIDDVVTLGFYSTADDACYLTELDPTNSDYSNYPMLSNVSGGTTEIKEQHASYLYPYASTSRRVYAVLRFGHDEYCLSNPVDIHIPDTTMKVAVSSGDTFMLDGLWYKATTDLAVGDTLVIGTNCLAIDEPVVGATDSCIQSTTITTVWSGTQAQYDQIVNKDPNTLYFIKET